MGWMFAGCAQRAASVALKISAVLAGVATLALAGCAGGHPDFSAMQPRGATVAFDSIDGMPRPQFERLVQNLNDEAQARRLAVVSRDANAAYRVRGYLTADVAKDKTTVSWVWDVFDAAQNRSLRIAGTQDIKGRRDGWPAVDDGLLRQIAYSSMDQLAAFLTSPDVAPGAAQVAFVPSDQPEASGIFRIRNVDPLLTEGGAPAPIDARVPAHAAFSTRDAPLLLAESRHPSP